MMNIELSKWKEKGLDLEFLMRNCNNFKKLQREIRQEEVF